MKLFEKFSNTNPSNFFINKFYKAYRFIILQFFNEQLKFKIFKFIARKS